MKKLTHLTPNSTIGIIAPASSDDIETMNINIEKFKHLGFNIKLSKHLFDKEKYLSASDKDRASDLMDFFQDPNVDAILCYRGGFGSIRMLPYLDFKIIKKNPKIFCGYSDITALLNTINKNCNFATFHGPMVNSNFSDVDTYEEFLNVLSLGNSGYYYNLDKFQCSYINKKNFSGKLVGGNLTLICSLMGTDYEIDTKNNIVLIEEINESPYVVDRMLSQLIESKKLTSASAIILGHFTDCNPQSVEKSYTISELIVYKLASLNIPIVYNFPSGHSYPNIVLPIGVELNFNSSTNRLIISNDLFK